MKQSLGYSASEIEFLNNIWIIEVFRYSFRKLLFLEMHWLRLYLWCEWVSWGPLHQYLLRICWWFFQLELCQRMPLSRSKCAQAFLCEAGIEKHKLCFISNKNCKTHHLEFCLRYQLFKPGVFVHFK